MSWAELYLSEKKRLAKAGLQNPAFLTGQLFCHCFGSHYFEMAGEPNRSQIKEFRDLCSQLVAGKPLQYIIGEWDFYGRTFLVGSGVLIPRPETELIIDRAVERYKKNRDLKVLDLCSGSGCIAITLAAELSCERVVALEKYSDALGYLKKNIQLHESMVEPLQADILSDFNLVEDGVFDIITANPPYIKTGELEYLEKNVQKEPRTALDGGSSGLIFYQAIAEHWKQKLRSGGRIFVEIGIGQSEEVSGLFHESGLKDIKVYKDFSGIERVVEGKYLN